MGGGAAVAVVAAAEVAAAARTRPRLVCHGGGRRRRRRRRGALAACGRRAARRTARAARRGGAKEKTGRGGWRKGEDAAGGGGRAGGTWSGRRRRLWGVAGPRPSLFLFCRQCFRGHSLSGVANRNDGPVGALEGGAGGAAGGTRARRPGRAGSTKASNDANTGLDWHGPLAWPRASRAGERHPGGQYWRYRSCAASSLTAPLRRRRLTMGAPNVPGTKTRAVQRIDVGVSYPLSVVLCGSGVFFVRLSAVAQAMCARNDGLVKTTDTSVLTMVELDTVSNPNELLVSR